MAELKFAGDVKVEEITIRSLNTGKRIDIRNQVIGINIYEDLFSPFISGSLSIEDSLDIHGEIPFVGEEIVTLKISTPSIKEKIDIDFYVYKMSDRIYLGDRSVAYSLHFISEEAVKDINLKISRAFSGNVSDILNNIVKTNTGLNTPKKYVFENTASTIKFVSNFWKPTEIIKFLCQRVKSRENRPTYIFFENRDGFNFRTLDNLYGQSAIQEFNYNNFSKEVTGSNTYRNVDLDYKKIIDLTIQKSFDYLSDSESGRYGSKMFSYDVTTKRYKLESFDYYEDFYKSKHLNPNPPVSASIIKRTAQKHIFGMKIEQAEIFQGYGTTTTGNIDFQNRVSSIISAESNKVTVTVPGRFDYTVGRKVNLKLYKVAPIRSGESNNDLIDKINSGDYIISAINHTISRAENKHTCYMELIKDSTMKDLNKK